MVVVVVVDHAAAVDEDGDDGRCFWLHDMNDRMCCTDTTIVVDWHARYLKWIPRYEGADKLTKMITRPYMYDIT